MTYKHQAKGALYEQFARIGKAVSSPRRLELLDLLCQGERTVEALANEASLSIANASRHLQVLRAARLVETRKEGQYVYYRLADRAVLDFWQALKELAKGRLAEVAQVVASFLNGRDQMEPIDREELLERARDGSVIVLDVRPRDEYLAGHIPGAVSIPLQELERHLGELPREQEFVAYCRGPYCVLALKAVRMLRGRGFTARRLEDGIPEWRARGLPVDVGDED